MQLNFHQIGGDSLYLYYPVILIGISVIVLVNPLRIFHYRSRMWLLYSLVRLTVSSRCASADSLPVAFVPRWLVPCRMARFLFGGHVLFSDLYHECKLHLSQLLIQPLTT
jgi:hypothetical protein